MAENKYRKCAFAFLDILGYKNIVNSLDENKDKAMEFIYNLESLMDGCLSTIDIYKDMGIEYIIFSDSICIWAYLDDDDNYSNGKFSYEYLEQCYYKILSLCQVICGIQRRGVRYNLLFRGAISIGNSYHTRNVLFSSALVKSYIAEGQQSIYPRIILNFDNDDDILKALKDSLLATGWLCYYDNQVMTDFVGIVYGGNFFMHELIALELDQIRDIIQRGLDEYRDNEHIFEKYEWLAQYFNLKLRGAYKEKMISV